MLISPTRLLGHSKVLSPHVTNQVRLPKGGEVIFTLKEHFDRVTFALEGVRGEYSRTFTVLGDIRDTELDHELSVGEAPRTSPEGTHSRCPSGGHPSGS